MTGSGVPLSPGVAVTTDEWVSVGFGVDAEGCPTEDLDVDGVAVRLRHEDQPDMASRSGARVLRAYLQQR